MPEKTVQNLSEIEVKITPKSVLKSARLTTETGHTWKTSISANAIDESTIHYFLGQHFDIGEYPEEKLEEVVKVECFDSDGELTTTASK